ncbi:flagellar FliL protein [Rubricella aquisinus]|uniref:Flagellar protein FliL n=1 Tax=Rubricella aquisinus TaxID=2028108 RepID=A0A840WNF5_9RHOB|nr:flagellar basal body-associated FliL family protein [Rubricella aquisinus]MBB5516598.1 flagellar FliL protein [Rubricella aquisinus]
MSDDADSTGEDTGGKGGLKSIIIGVLAAVVLGGAGFYVSYSGLIGGATAGSAATESKVALSPGDRPVFVPIPQLTITFPPDGRTRMLRFTAELEVDRAYRDEVEALLPRINDVFNTYLRAVDLAELEAPSSMLRLRAQMLRRVQIVTGPGRVQDLLITEFILS